MAIETYEAEVYGARLNEPVLQKKEDRAVCLGRSNKNECLEFQLSVQIICPFIF